MIRWYEKARIGYRIYERADDLGERVFLEKWVLRRPEGILEIGEAIDSFEEFLTSNKDGTKVTA